MSRSQRRRLSMSSDDLKSDALVSRRASVGLARQSSKASIFSAKDDEPRHSRQRRQSSVSSNRSHGKARETYDTDELSRSDSSVAPSDAESAHSEGEAERAAREAREERKRKETDALVVPDLGSMVYERELRRVATRGVSALFAAIAEHQQAATDDADADESRSAKRKRKSKSKAARGLSGNRGKVSEREAGAAEKARRRDERTAAFSSAGAAQRVQDASKDAFLAMLRGRGGPS